MRPRLVLAVPVLLASALLAGCGDKDSTAQVQPEPRETPVWQKVPSLPLSPRGAPTTVWTGTEVLVIGGETGDACPPNADCAVANENASDGAALDPDSGTWRPIKDAPVPVGSYTTSAVVEGHVFLRVGEKLLDYDIERDRWQVLPRTLSEWYDLEADGTRLVAVSGSDEAGVRPDLVYVPASGKWSELPEDPWGPMFGRGVVSTPQGLLLVGAKLSASPGAGDKPSYVLGALLDPRTNTWSKLPASDQLGGGYWGAIDNRVVNVSLDSTNGGGKGKGDYGRQIPFGGTLDLDERTWGRLPHPPKYLTGGWPVGAVGNRLIAAEGWIYDDLASSWTKIPRPRGGAVQPGPAVWAGEDLLVVIGGTNQTADNVTDRDSSVWTWRPETANRY